MKISDLINLSIAIITGIGLFITAKQIRRGGITPFWAIMERTVIRLTDSLLEISLLDIPFLYSW